MEKGALCWIRGTFISNKVVNSFRYVKLNIDDFQEPDTDCSNNFIVIITYTLLFSIQIVCYYL